LKLPTAKETGDCPARAAGREAKISSVGNRFKQYFAVFGTIGMPQKKNQQKQHSLFFVADSCDDAGSRNQTTKR
jgi:hypothetical protein